MSSEVWYRKWRPQTFAEVVGQKHVTQTLARAVAADRVAHAYVFCGPRGTGKTSTARILAKAVNCEANEDGQPCTRCASCVAVTEGRALDLIEMDAASNRGIDDIRSLRDKVGYSPNASRYKVYLIDEAHELTANAFDALLKTLEEPPPHVIFVLATTEAHKLPETILSRCQRFDFQRIKLADVVARLQQIAEHENVEADEAALEILARRATGSLRDAVNQLEQAVARQGNHLTEESVRSGPGSAGDQRAATLVELLLGRRLAEVLTLVADVRDDGGDLRQFAAAAVQQLRAVLLVRAGAGASLTLSDEALEALGRVAEASSVADVLRAARLLSAVDFRADPQSPLPLELALIDFIEGPGPAAVAGGSPAVANAQSGVPDNRLMRPAAPAAPAPESRLNPAERVRSALAPRTAPPAGLRGRAVGAPPPSRDGRTSRENGAGREASAADAEGANSSPGRDARGPERPSIVAESAALDAPHAGGGEPAEGGAEAAPEHPEELDDGGPLTLDRAQRQFRRLYERCRQLNPVAGRLLNSAGCDIVDIGDDTITIGFMHERMLAMAQQAPCDGVLRRGVADVYGSRYGVRYLLVPDVPSRLQLLSAEQPSHLLDEALRLGAKPVGR